jgi:indoleamine 2,3-dioxygenase
MSPHKVELLPSIAAMPSYGISKNGFLPAETPLSRLPHRYYQPWEGVIDELPTSIETQAIRQLVDQLPVLSTSFLSSEAEWQRAYSMLALIAQGYIWAGPEPSEVSCESIVIVMICIADFIEETTSCHYRSILGSLRASRSASDCNVCGIQPLELAAT